MTMTTSKELSLAAIKALGAKMPLAEIPRGAEGGSAEDLAIPRFQLVQDKSTLAKQGHPVGHFVNSLTGQSCESFELIPIKMTKYVDLLRKENARMVFDHRVFDLDSPELEGRRYFADRKNDVKADANRVIAWSGLVGGMPATVSFKKSNYEAGKSIYSMVVFSRKDAWASKYKVSSVVTVSKDGESYYTIKVEPIGQTAPEEASQAEYFFQVFGGKPIESVVGDAQEEVA